jgi:hypothetical protein
MNRSSWKSGERRIARKFDSERTPLSGGNSKHTRSDTLNKNLFIEVKHGLKVPGDRIWRKTLDMAKKENKIPAVVFIKKNYPYPVIMCKVDDLTKIASEIKESDSDIISALDRDV